MVGGVGCYSPGKGAIPIRRAGDPWCPFLGLNTTIQEDIALQAVFAAWDAIGDEAVWSAARISSASTFRASKLLLRLRADGVRLLAAVQTKRWMNSGKCLPYLSGGLLQDLFIPEWPSS
jgi:hypothetical protein